MRTLLILLLLIVPNVYAADVYIRDDGGNLTECDGSVDAKKNSTGKCSLNYFSKNMKFATADADRIIFSKGTFSVNVQPPSLWITMEQFNAKPEYYIREAKKGRKVYFQRIDGIAYELILRKY